MIGPQAHFDVVLVGQLNLVVQELRAKTSLLLEVIVANVDLSCMFFLCFFCSGVGKGDGSDLKVKIILKKQQVFQCVCAKQENCSVGLFTNTRFRPRLLQTHKRIDQVWGGF